MSIMLLDFTYNMERGSSDWDDYYSTPLSKQWENIQRRYNICEDLQTVMDGVFSRYDDGCYYLSIPNILREIKQDKNGTNKYCNIVIRSRKAPMSMQGFSIILIGDIKESKVLALSVKGIEVIENASVGEGEKEIYCNCRCAYNSKTLPNGGKIPDFGENYIHSLPLLFTLDYVRQLWDNELLANPKIRSAYQKWANYMAFRQYWLEVQGKKGMAIDRDGVEVLDTYSISSKEFRFNKDKYADYVLGEEFTKGEQVVLTEKIGEADGFPLVKVVISKNRKAELADVDKRSGEPKTRGVIARFTSNNDIALSAFDDAEKGKNIQLDERYKSIIVEEIEPSVDDIERKFVAKKEKQFGEIDSKYKKTIDGEVDLFLGQRRREYESTAEAEHFEIRKKLDAQVAEAELKAEQFKKEYDRARAENKDPKKASSKERDDRSAELFSSVNLLKDKNARLLLSEETRLKNGVESKIQADKMVKRRDLGQKYSLDIQREKETIAAICEKDKQAEIAVRIENETVLQYQIYFRIDESDARQIRADIAKINPQFMVIDTFAEKIKIERQEKALNAFFQGYVKNPFLINYLFSPETLKRTNIGDVADIQWVLSDPLNERQKEAVCKALASESIFLLQGPPGTGKTQVIAELVAQYTKRGKKVLISSETHKAIDNVFERLPKDPNIRPLRMIPKRNNKKETEYSPDKLLPNFYRNIRTRLEQEIKRFTNFYAAKETFRADFAVFEKENGELNKNAKVLAVMTKLIARLEAERAELQNEYSKVKMQIDSLDTASENTIEEMLMRGVDLSQIDITVGADTAVLESELADWKNKLAAKEQEIVKLASNTSFEELQNKKTELTHKIERFFSEQKIRRTYKTLDEALVIIAEEWQALERDFARREKENKAKIPMYEEICSHLKSPSILESDIGKYTQELFENANVFGITATSNDRYSEKNNEGLARCGLKELNIREQGIDVVIIDEVSKSSFIDLLIPILYGKTVILVGDHKQLPPMYDLRHLKKAELIGLDENLISEHRNADYTAMYEECFFKTLYEKIPSDYKVMLTRQYRCHEDIMRVFNHFYGANEGKGLELGYENQNAKKQHNLDIRIDGKSVIERGKHIYFVNCNEFDEGEEGSTSRHNKQEAEVVVRLLTDLDEACGDYNLRYGIKVDRDNEIDERHSIGVICTYGEQAGKIKRSGIVSRCSNFNKSSDNKLVISTVDDFQGDERDIIILSMVRNPRRRTGNYDFVKKPERINVALSRARKMLIIIGNRNFLSDEGVIDLQDTDGRITKGYPVYRKIVETVGRYGKVIEAEEILTGNQSKGGRK